MTRPRTTVVMCLLALAAVVAAVITERVAPMASAPETTLARRVFADAPIPVGDVDQITLQRRGEAAMLFVRDPQRGWEQLEPFPHPMEGFSVRQLAALAAELQAVKRLELQGADDALSPAVLGLDPPAAILILDWPGGSAALNLGRRTVAGRAYATVEGRPEILVVGAELHERALGANPRDWRDRRMFFEAGVESQRIEMTGAGADVVLERDRREWKMTAPLEARVNRRTLDDLMAAIGRAQVDGFVLDQPDDLVRFGLDPPRAVFTITGAGADAPRVQRLLVGERIFGGDARYGLVEGRPTVVRLNEPVLRALFRQPETLVSAVASGVEPADVKSIRIDGPGGDFTLERDLERWIAPDHGGAEVEPAAVERLLEILTRVHAPQVILEPFPRQFAVARVTFFGYGRRPLDTVQVARRPEATREGDPWILENGDGVLRVFPASLQPPLAPGDFGLADRGQ